MPKTISEEMLPTPYITEAVDQPVMPVEVESAQLATLNYESKQIRDGVDPRILPMASLAVRVAEQARSSVTDKMTGLLNREGMQLWMERYKPAAFGVIFADGRKFKQFNNISYDAGDEVIARIGQQFVSKLRIRDAEQPDVENRSNSEAHDALGIMRFGGDEFMAVVDLSSVEEDKRQEVLNSIIGRLQDFGTYENEAEGVSLPIEVDAVGILGRAEDNLTLDQYRRQLNDQLLEIKSTRDNKA